MSSPLHEAILALLRDRHRRAITSPDEHHWRTHIDAVAKDAAPEGELRDAARALLDLCCEGDGVWTEDSACSASEFHAATNRLRKALGAA